MSTNWKYTDSSNRVVFRVLPDGTQESCIATALTTADLTAVLAADPPSQAETVALFSSLILQRLDDFAKTRNYDSMLSACTYANSANLTFKAEGQCCVNLRDATWAAHIALLAEVSAGTRTIDSWATLESLLPALAWPQPGSI